MLAKEILKPARYAFSIAEEQANASAYPKIGIARILSSENKLQAAIEKLKECLALELDEQQRAYIQSSIKALNRGGKI